MRRLTVISLGGGVQSSVMALMATEGAFDAVELFSDEANSEMMFINAAGLTAPAIPAT